MLSLSETLDALISVPDGAGAELVADETKEATVPDKNEESATAVGIEESVIEARREGSTADAGIVKVVV